MAQNEGFFHRLKVLFFGEDESFQGQSQPADDRDSTRIESAQVESAVAKQLGDEDVMQSKIKLATTANETQTRIISDDTDVAAQADELLAGKNAKEAKNLIKFTRLLGNQKRRNLNQYSRLGTKSARQAGYRKPKRGRLKNHSTPRRTRRR